MSITLNGKSLNISAIDNENWLNTIYNALKIEYPKFFKMDNLCKAGFLASELIFNEIGLDRTEIHKDIAIILFNSVSSLDDDLAYQKTISDKDNFFPSPAIFVYTLANIVTGEIAIRNKIQGESSFYILEKYSEEKIEDCVSDVFLDKTVNSVICGWIDVLDDILNVKFMYYIK